MVFNNGFKIQFTVVPHNSTTNSYFVWTFPVAFETIVFGVFYTSGIDGEQWNHSSYMHHHCCDWVRKTSANLFAHILDKTYHVVQGFAVVYGF